MYTGRHTHILKYSCVCSTHTHTHALLTGLNKKDFKPWSNIEKNIKHILLNESIELKGCTAPGVRLHKRQNYRSNTRVNRKGS